MKKIALLLALILILATLNGCGEAGDFFAPFRGGFCAELDGTWRGIDFAARAEMQPPKEGEALAEGTITFYAPDALAGTVLRRDTTGALTLTVGTLTCKAPDAYGALFDLFVTQGEVTEVSLAGDITTVTGEGFSLSLDACGTPTALSNAAAEVRVLSFEQAP